MLNFVMAPIQTQAIAGTTKRKIHPSLNIDMTPMEDLGFLLITFFIFTTTMAEKRAVGLIMPKDGDVIDLAESKALTAILGGDNKVFVYAGKWEDAVTNQKIVQSNYSLYQGLGDLIRTKQKQLGQKKDKMFLIIKPLGSASYLNVIDALDEALINNVQKYAVVEASTEEKNYIGKLK
jgi:biopolymer transport protein ExbD